MKKLAIAALAALSAIAASQAQAVNISKAAKPLVSRIGGSCITSCNPYGICVTRCY